jgi:hypothetical protein
MTSVVNAREGGDDRTDSTDDPLRKSDLSSEIISFNEVIWVSATKRPHR